jgi:hypothetical protein
MDHLVGNRSPVAVIVNPSDRNNRSSLHLKEKKDPAKKQETAFANNSKNPPATGGFFI